VQGSGGVIEQVDRDLRLPVLLDIPANGPDGFQAAGDLDGFALGVAHDVALRVTLRPSVLANRQRDLVRQFAIERIQIDVVGEQKFASANHRRTRPVVERARTRVWRPIGFLELACESLVFARANRGQAPAVFASGRVFVEVDRDAEFISDAPPDRPGDVGAFGHRDVRHRDERADVERAHARMRPAVRRHVDEFACRARGSQRGVGDRIRVSDKRVDGAVRVGAWIDVEQLHATHA
jgi:hypothetical protein